jgi:hypothetical protein
LILGFAANLKQAPDKRMLINRIELGQAAFAISAIKKRQRANDRIGMGQHLLDRLIEAPE